MSPPEVGDVYLAYFDDSGSDAKSPVVLVWAIVVQDEIFAHLEDLIGMMVENIIPEEKRNAFEEFHSTELYWGQGVFAGISQEERYQGIRHLLGIIASYKLPFVYSAVERKRLVATAMGGGPVVDIAFRMCALGIQDWLGHPSRRKSSVGQLEHGRSLNPLCVFIADDTADGGLKKTLKTSFGILRGKAKYGGHQNRLSFIHDDMYFGSSKDSIGIQLADLCAFFMMRHLRDGEEDEFYQLFCHLAICAEPSPDWTTNREFFKKHRRDRG